MSYLVKCMSLFKQYISQLYFFYLGGAMEMTQRGAYSGIDADERSLPTERINTARHGKRTLTDRPPRHDYAQDNVFNLTYKYYQDWMVSIACTDQDNIIIPALFHLQIFLCIFCNIYTL